MGSVLQDVLVHSLSIFVNKMEDTRNITEHHLSRDKKIKKYVEHLLPDRYDPTTSIITGTMLALLVFMWILFKSRNTLRVKFSYYHLILMNYFSCIFESDPTMTAEV